MSIRLSAMGFRANCKHNMYTLLFSERVGCLGQFLPDRFNTYPSYLILRKKLCRYLIDDKVLNYGLLEWRYRPTYYTMGNGIHAYMMAMP